MHFDTEISAQPYPHLYITLDVGSNIEVPLYKFLRVEAPEEGTHTVTIIVKSAAEFYHRWSYPLIDKVSFLGVTVDSLLPPPVNNKKTIEFVGDFITEGVVVDADLSEKYEPFCHVYQDDTTATYGYLAAKALNLEPYFMAYGGVGITKGGSGGVPKCIDAYDYSFANVRKPYNNCDYILINHGANDRGASAEDYTDGYRALLNHIIRENPRSKIIVLSAFCGAYHEQLGKMVENYNRENDATVLNLHSAAISSAQIGMKISTLRQDGDCRTVGAVATLVASGTSVLI